MRFSNKVEQVFMIRQDWVYDDEGESGQALKSTWYFGPYSTLAVAKTIATTLRNRYTNSVASITVTVLCSDVDWKEVS